MRERVVPMCYFAFCCRHVINYKRRRWRPVILRLNQHNSLRRVSFLFILDEEKNLKLVTAVNGLVTCEIISYVSHIPLLYRVKQEMKPIRPKYIY